jgi:hypothetical protein
MRLLAMALILAALGAAPASASDPLASLRFLVGTWNCTYQAAKVRVSYKATFAYDMSGNWLSERDSSTGGGSGLGMITYEPKRRGWTVVIVEPDRTATVFHATGDNPNHIVYHSVYPDASMTDVFDRSSPTRYTLHFTQSTAGKTMKSTDVCVKS